MKIKIHKAASKGKFAPLAWIIKKNQKTKWNHYAIEYSIDGEFSLFSDAKRKGIRRVGSKKWNKGYKVIDTIEVKLPCTPQEFNDFVESKLGTKYAFWQLIGIGMLSWGVIKCNPFGKGKKYLVCHEYVLVALARFLKLELSHTDDYTFRKADKVIESVRLK